MQSTSFEVLYVLHKDMKTIKRGNYEKLTIIEITGKQPSKEFLPHFWQMFYFAEIQWEY
jgi:hypothetical protein